MSCYVSQDQAARDKALQTMASMSSAQIVSASVLHNKALAAAGIPAFNNENQGYQVCSAITDDRIPGLEPYFLYSPFFYMYIQSGWQSRLKCKLCINFSLHRFKLKSLKRL